MTFHCPSLETDAEAEAPVLWPPDAKNQIIGKDPDAGKDGRQKKGMAEDEMVSCHHRLNGHGFGWTPAVGDGQGGLGYCSPWGCKESDTTERLNNNNKRQRTLSPHPFSAHALPLWWGQPFILSPCIEDFAVISVINSSQPPMLIRPSFLVSELKPSTQNAVFPFRGSHQSLLPFPPLSLPPALVEEAPGTISLRSAWTYLLAYPLTHWVDFGKDFKS